MSGLENQQWIVLLIALMLAGNRLLVANMTIRQLGKIAASGQAMRQGDFALARRQIKLSKVVAALWVGVGVAALYVADWPQRVALGVLVAAATGYGLHLLLERKLANTTLPEIQQPEEASADD